MAAATLAVYAGAFDHDFVDWDDQDYVEQNPLVREQRWGELLTAVVSNHYHPLTMLSLALDVRRPLEARPFIATSVTLHVLNTLLVLWLVLRLVPGRVAVAGLTALLFGIHPIHVESVAWISERKDVLYAFFFLAAAIAYLRYLERRAFGWLALTFALFVASCLAKEMAVAFPAVLVLLDWWKGRRPLGPRALLEKAPFVAVSALVGLVVVDLQSGRDFHGLLQVVGPHEVVMSAPPGLSPLQRLSLPTYGYMMYLWRLLVPLDLCAFYPFPDPVEAGRWPFRVAPLVFLATLALAVRDARRGRWIAFATGWYLATVALVLRWIPAGLVIMGDRYAYLSSIGPFLLLAIGLDRAAARRPGLRPVVWGAAFAFAIGMFALAVPQVATWKDSEALWSRVIRLQPRVGSAYLYRGKHRFDRGQVAEAGEDFRAAWALGVHSGEVYGGLGIAYGARGKLDSALVMLDRAVELLPGRPAVYHNRAVTLLAMGRPREALADIDRALALGPVARAGILSTRGYAHLRLGDPRAALGEFDQAIAAGAEDGPTWYGRALGRLQLGDSAGAAADLEESLRRGPGNEGARELLRRLGR